MTTIGARLYATAWFAAAAAGVGVGAYGAVATVVLYNDEAGKILPEARKVWAETAVPSEQLLFPTNQARADAKAAADRRWFVDLEYRKAGGYSETAEQKAVVASYERIHPFKPDMTAANVEAAAGAAVTALVASMPILLLTLLRWVATGKRCFGFRS